jgi:hypothetical protein
MPTKLLPFWYQSVCHTTRASKSEIFLIVETRILFRIQIKWHGQLAKTSISTIMLTLTPA